MQLLKVKDLNISFTNDTGIIHAVNNISFSINKGESLGIVGESGSGKTVTSLSIMRLLSRNASTKGEVIYTPPDGFPIDLASLPDIEMPNYRGNHISMIFQEPMTSLNPVFSCGNQVAEALIAHTNVTKTEAKKTTISLFEKVKLERPEQIFDSYPYQLSGGQKQRVMIAMSIICNPSLLIADEPTTALDVTVQSAILSLMRSLQQENNMSMLFISHDLGVVAEVADRVLVMYKGKVVEEGLVDDIFSKPKHPYTKGLLACRPPLSKRLRILPTVRDFMQEVNNEIVEIKSNPIVPNNEISSDEIHSVRKMLYSIPPVLQVQNVKVHFPIKEGILSKTTGYIQAVDDVSFDVYSGETLGLVGESGCGKTTLGRTITGLIEPTAGKIIYREKNLSALSGKELRQMRKQIQIIFQDPYSSLNPRLSIGNAILEPMIVHNMHLGKRKAKVFQLLEMVNLSPDHFNRFPHEFSGGQRQRICIARALSLEPEFLICDECVSSLDVSIQAQILNLLNKLKQDLKFSCVFISHDLSVVKFMSDRMIVMNNGKVEEIGDPEQIYNSPASPYTRKLIEAIPVKSYSLNID